MEEFGRERNEKKLEERKENGGKRKDTDGIRKNRGGGVRCRDGEQVTEREKR